MKTLYSTINGLGRKFDSKNPEDVAVMTAIAEAVVYYVIGLDDAYECQRKLKELIDERDISAQRFRLLIADVAYIHLNLKYFVLNLIKTNTKKETIEKFQTAFAISFNDCCLIKAVMSTRGFKKLAKTHTKNIAKSEIDAKAFANVFKTFNAIQADLMRHIKHKTYSKLRFISSSSNIEFYDLHMELMCKALQTYIKMVPTKKTELHIANYLRSTLNNHTTNMIKSNTTKKRGRLVKAESDGFGGNRFEMVAVAENQLFRAFGVDETVSYESLRSSDDNRDEEKRRDSNINYERILKKFGTNRVKRQFIELISCQENARFTKHLKHIQKINAGDDNVDYHAAVGEDKYFSAVCEFLRVCERRAKRFVKYIGKKAYPELAKNTGVK